jgi:hypothetical protein
MRAGVRALVPTHSSADRRGHGEAAEETTRTHGGLPFAADKSGNKAALAQHLAPAADTPKSAWLSSVLQRGGATSAQLRGGFAELNATVLRIPHVVSTLAHEASPSSTAERSHERSCKTARQPAPAGPNMRTTATTSPRCRTQPNHHKRAAAAPAALVRRRPLGDCVDPVSLRELGHKCISQSARRRTQM